MQVKCDHSSAAVGHNSLVARPGLFGQATNDVTPLLGGTAESQCLVLVGIGGAVFGITASHDGEWVLDTAAAVPLSGCFDLGFDGVKAVRITCINAAGASREIHGDFLLKTTAPELPVMETTNVCDARPVLSGRAEAGCEVTVQVGGASYRSVAGGDGNWRIDTAEQLADAGYLNLRGDGRKRVTLVCRDPAGNVSETEQFFMLDRSNVLGVVEMGPVASRRLLDRGFERLPGAESRTRTWWPLLAMKRGRQASHGASR